MTVLREPCLTTAQLKELIPRLPDSVYVQRITIEACRVSRKDIRRTETQFFDTKQAYPSLYIPAQTLIFSTPLWINSARFDRSNEWGNFIKDLEEADKLCAEFEFEDASSELTDTLLSDRLFIKDIILLELPKDEPSYHEPPYFPQKSDDRFYDGIRCSFATFSGSYQLVGSVVQEERDGWLPGMTRKPMDLEHIEVVRTKHVKRLRGKRSLKAFHRRKEDIYKEEKADLVNHPERVRAWLPTLLDKELIIWKELTGDWEEIKRFRPSAVSLTMMLKEKEDIEISKEERDKILKSMKNNNEMEGSA